ncbi:hypothetical protein DFJ58DRAFT_798010, partial [Suillus subalutaceus]|uniref:uncharacterized protein n=1 Tax=Suillus subalutaceus TaxID=48586 RepID=UPI001B87D20A
MASGTIGTLNYLIAPLDGSRPYNRMYADTSATAKPAHNWTQEPHDMQVEDVRGKEELYKLDNAGFQFGREAAKHASFLNDDEIQREYYPESIDLIKRVTGATNVVIFDHTIRRRRPGEPGDNPQKRQPVSSVHVDQTTASSISRVHRHLPPTEAPSLLRRRFQIINIWRPISHAAVDWPLALCDLPQCRCRERLGFDSIQDGSVARLTPHTGFQDPNTPEGTPPRESIELRALVFY